MLVCVVKVVYTQCTCWYAHGAFGLLCAVALKCFIASLHVVCPVKVLSTQCTCCDTQRQECGLCGVFVLVSRVKRVSAQCRCWYMQCFESSLYKVCVLVCAAPWKYFIASAFVVGPVNVGFTQCIGGNPQCQERGLYAVYIVVFAVP